MFKILVKFFLIVVSFIALFELYSLASNESSPQNIPQVQAQAVTPVPTCVGDEISYYAGSVLKGLRDQGVTLNKVRLVTPIFNLTDPGNPELVTAFKAGLAQQGFSINDFDFMAGNAYNTVNGGISGYVNSAYPLFGTTRPLLLTETGWFFEDASQRPTQADYDRAREEIKTVLNGGNVAAALYFIPYPPEYGTNGDPNFIKHHYTGSDFRNDLCPDGNCSRIGANSGTFYPTDVAFYNRVNNDSAKYTLSIGNFDESFESYLGPNGGLTLAHARGLTPIIRLGVNGSGGGFDPTLDPATGKPRADKLLQFIALLDKDPRLQGEVYISLGPNEPLTECWAAPGCAGCGSYLDGLEQDDFVCNVKEDDPIVKTIRVNGQITQSTWTDVPNPDPKKKPLRITGLPFRNAVVTNYTGDVCTISKLGAKEQGGMLVNIDYKRSPHITSDSAGKYSLVIHQTEQIKDRFIAYSCNGKIADLYKCDLTKDTDGEIKLDVDLNCQGEYHDVSATGNALRPYLDLRPESPGEGIPLSDLSKFTVCLEAPYTESVARTSRPEIRKYLEDLVEDEHGDVKQIVSKVDVDRSRLPPFVSPDLNCDPNNVPPPYEECMPQSRIQVLRDEFNNINPKTSMARALFSYEHYVADNFCGPFNQKAGIVRYDGQEGNVSPHSDKVNKLKPSLVYIEAMNKVLGSDGVDALGKVNVNSLDYGLSRLVNNPAKLKKKLAVVDPNMCYAFNGAGECVLLGEVEVPYFGGKTLYEVLGVPPESREGTNRYPVKYFPGPCLTETPWSVETMGNEHEMTHNVDDTADTGLGGSCEDPEQCARDLPINQLADEGDEGVGKDTTGRRPYMESVHVEIPFDETYELGGDLVYPGPDSASAGSTGQIALLSLPNDKRFKSKEVEGGRVPEKAYVPEGDKECKKVGYPLVNYCMCAHAEHVTGMCPTPLNRANVINEGSYQDIKDAVSGHYAGGSVVLGDFSAGLPDKFLESSILIWDDLNAIVRSYIAAGWAYFHGSKEDQGGKCLQYDWGEWQPNYCPGYGPNATDMVVPCVVTYIDENGNPQTRVKEDCECENTCRVQNPANPNDFSPCNEAQRITCSDASATIVCLHRVKDQPPNEWAREEHPDCIGDSQGTIKVRSDKGTFDPSLAVAALSDPFRIPGVKRNSCAIGGIAATVQSTYELYDNTSYNDIVKTDHGNYLACALQENYRKISEVPKYHGEVVPGDAVIGRRANPNSTCNAFNVDTDGDGVVDPISFEESLEVAARTLAGDVTKQTSQLIDEYGPYCIVEFSGSPYAWNLVDFIDRESGETPALSRKCTNRMPPKTLRKQDEGQASKQCAGYGRSPGDTDFDYYRGALNSNSCGLKTNAWAKSVTEEQVLNSLKDAYYNGNYMNDEGNPALKALRDQQLPLVVAKAKEKNVNPYLLVGIWGTESGWSNRPSCYNSANP